MTLSQFKTSKAFLYGGGLAVLAVALLVAAQVSTAADQYTFTARGDVVQIDGGHKTVKLYGRWTSSTGEADIAGHTVELNVANTRYYKYNDKQQKVRTTLGALTVGDEIVVKGAKKSGGNFNASEITRNDNRVKLRGTVDTQDVTNNFFKVELDSVVYASTGKAYKPTQFKKSDIIWVYYDDDSTKFRTKQGKAMEEDQFSNNNEKITVEAVDVRFGSRFVAGPEATITDNIWKF